MQRFADTRIGVVDEIERGKHPTNGDENTGHDEESRTQDDSKTINELANRELDINRNRQAVVETVASAIFSQYLEDGGKDADGDKCVDAKL